MFSYGMPDADGRNPFWAGWDTRARCRRRRRRRRPCHHRPEAGQTLEADVVVVGSGCGGGLVAGKLAQAGRKVIVVEAGSYLNESDFVQLELAAYQTLFLRGGFFNSAEGMIASLRVPPSAAAAPSTGPTHW